MRKYANPWKELRDTLRLELVAAVPWHSRIRNGIRKERYHDLAHAIYLSETKQYDRMTCEVKGKVLIFTLVRKPKTSDLDMSDLF